MAFLKDRMSLADKAPVTFAPDQIGKTRRKTPEGFLLCQDVRIARTGPMMYAHHEMPDIKPDGPAMITILRDSDVLFSDVSMSSFAAKPVTNDHPTTAFGVTPDNYKQFAVGTVINPRQGEGVDSEYLVGDLLITDAKAIKDVDAGKREVSAGYDVEVVQLKPGLGRVTSIVGNHVALVRRGRAGPLCAIQDKEPKMARKKLSLMDRLRRAWDDEDEEAFAEGLGEMNSGGGSDPQTLVIKVEGAGDPPADPAAGGDPAAGEGGGDIDARFQRIEASIAAIAEAVGKLVAGGGKVEDPPKEENLPKTGEEVPPAKEPAEKDPAEEKDVEKTAAMDAISKAEILAPGVKIPTMDAAATTVKASVLTELRRVALKKAYDTEATKVHIDSILGGRTVVFDTLPPGELAMIFDGAAALTKQANNSNNVTKFAVPQGPMTTAKYQEMLNKRRASRAEQMAGRKVS